MAINFPATTGQPTDGSFTHTVGNVTWSWNGTAWGKSTLSDTFFADGSDSSPSITFASDTDTGLYRTTSNVLSVTAGSEIRLHVGSSPTLQFVRGATDTNLQYNYLIKGYNDTGAAAIHFVNDSTRTSDGGANTYTIRNDIGPIRLGSTNTASYLIGDDIKIGSTESSYALSIQDNRVSIGTTSNVSGGETQALYVKTNGASERAACFEQQESTDYAEIRFQADARQYRVGVGGSTSQWPNKFYIYQTDSARMVSIFDDNDQNLKPYQVGFSAYDTADQSIPANSWTKMLFNSTRFNTGSAFSTSTSTFTAPATGQYIVGYTVQFQGASLQYYYSGIVLNGAFYHYGEGRRISATSTNNTYYLGDNTLSACQVVYMNANDYITYHAYCSSAVNISGSGTRRSAFAHFLG